MGTQEQRTTLQVPSLQKGQTLKYRVVEGAVFWFGCLNVILTQAQSQVCLDTFGPFCRFAPDV